MRSNLSYQDKNINSNKPEEESEINDLLSKLGATQKMASDKDTLFKLADLLAKGLDSNFISQIALASDLPIPAIWQRWNLIINNKIASSPPLDTKTITYRVADRAIKQLSPLKFILRDIPNKQSAGLSDSDGIKIIYLALLALPNSHKPPIKIEEIPSIFLKGILEFQEYDNLSLDFSRHDFYSVIETAEKIINDREYKAQSKHRVFLTSLRNSLAILLGVPLTKKQTNSSELTIDGQHSRPTKSQKTSKNIRLIPFRKIYSDILKGGSLVEIELEPEEPQLPSLLSEHTTEEHVNEPIVRAVAQTKAKHWLKTFHGNLPWGSRGINPITRQILINWIQTTNDRIALIFALMICTGNRIERVLEMKLGEKGDISYKGYHKTYERPKKSKEPAAEIAYLLDQSTNKYTLPLPLFLVEKLAPYLKQTKNENTLSGALGLDIDVCKEMASKQVKELIKCGATGLSIDRIPIVLTEIISEQTGDEFLSYLLAGRVGDMPPVSAYYSSYTIDELEKAYYDAVYRIFK